MSAVIHMDIAFFTVDDLMIIVQDWQLISLCNLRQRIDIILINMSLFPHGLRTFPKEKNMIGEDHEEPGMGIGCPQAFNAVSHGSAAAARIQGICGIQRKSLIIIVDPKVKYKKGMGVIQGFL